MQTLLQDLRYSARILFKKPGFTLIAALAIALGIGAVTTNFSAADATMLRPFSFPNQERLAIVFERNPEAGITRGSVSPADVIAWREQAQTLQEVVAISYRDHTLTGEGPPERYTSYRVSAAFFDAIGAQPRLGRVFRRGEDEEGNAQVVVLRHAFWQTRFGGDPKIVGKQIMLDDKPFEVIGVMPEDFEFPYGGGEMWTPFVIEQRMKQDHGSHYIRAMALLKPGATIAQANEELGVVSGRIQRQFPDQEAARAAYAVALNDEYTRGARTAMPALIGAPIFVLLIACANVANLLLARAATRRKEMAVRLAIGATRWRLMRQLLTESVMLALIGGAVGCLLAAWGIEAMSKGVPEGMAKYIPGWNRFGLNFAALVFTASVSVLTGVLFGLAPALQSSRPDLNETLKEGGKGGGSSSRLGRARNALIVVEVAMALVLLISAGLLIKSFRRLQEVDPGFDPRNLLTMRLFLPQSKYAEPQRRQAFFEQVLRRIESLPGVQAVGTSTMIPTLGGGDTYFTIEGRPFPDPNRKVTAFNPMVSHDYLRAMKIPLIKGRHFTEPETKEEKSKTLIINEAFARAYFADYEPLGKRLIVDMGEPWTCEIIGVAGDTTQFAFDVGAFPMMYLPSIRMGVAAVVVRANGDPLALTASVRAAVREVDRDLPIANVRSMDQIMSSMSGDARFRTLLLGVFAAVALLLAAIGIYGVIAYSVAQRTREIGIRIALGARGRDVLGLVIGQGMKFALIGVGVGMAGALALTRVLSDLLFNVSATDPLTFVGVSTLLGLVALLACYVPARRVMKVDPMVALRCE